MSELSQNYQVVLKASEISSRVEDVQVLMPDFVTVVNLALENMPSLRQKELVKFIKSKLELAGESATIQSVSYYQHGKQIVACGLDVPIVSGKRVALLPLLVYYTYVKMSSESRSAIFVVAKDHYIGAVACSKNGIEAYRFVDANEFETTARELYQLLQRKTGREPKLYTSDDSLFEGFEKFDMANGEDLMKLPRSLFLRFQRPMPWKAISTVAASAAAVAATCVLAVSSYNFVVNQLHLRKLQAKVVNLRRGQELLKSFQDKVPAQLGCASILLERDLPLQLKELQADSQSCRIATDLYFHTPIMLKLIKSNTWISRGVLSDVEKVKGDLYKVQWNYPAPMEARPPSLKEIRGSHDRASRRVYRRARSSSFLVKEFQARSGRRSEVGEHAYFGIEKAAAVFEAAYYSIFRRGVAYASEQGFRRMESHQAASRVFSNKENISRSLEGASDGRCSPHSSVHAKEVLGRAAAASSRKQQLPGSGHSGASSRLTSLNLCKYSDIEFRMLSQRIQELESLVKEYRQKLEEFKKVENKRIGVNVSGYVLRAVTKDLVILQNEDGKLPLTKDSVFPYKGELFKISSVAKDSVVLENSRQNAAILFVPSDIHVDLGKLVPSTTTQRPSGGTNAKN